MNAATETARHTPGPWAYEPTSGAIFFADGDVEPLIASTNLECVSVEQGDADGRLIAAAPDLLKALQDLVNSFEKHRPKEYWDAARAAISKATGVA